MTKTGAQELEIFHVNDRRSFRGENLEGVNFGGQDLTGIDFRFANLRKANIAGCNIQNAQFYGADVRQAKISEGQNIGDIWNAPGRITTTQHKGKEIPILSKYNLQSIPLLQRKISDPQNQKKVDKYNFIIGFLYETLATNDFLVMAHSCYLSAVNYAAAANNLGWMYEHGYGINQSLRTAMKYYETASRQTNYGSFNLCRVDANEQKSPISMYLLGSLYRTPERAPVTDMELAFYWLKGSADCGSKKGARYTGVMFRSGTGVARSYEEAFRYLQKAAGGEENDNPETGDAEAQYELGTLYEYGRGVQQDYKKAKFWFEHAAKSIDHMGALMRLGTLYSEGKGCDTSYHMAYNCFKAVAAQGRISGMYNQARMIRYLGLNYAEGVTLLKKVLQLDETHTGAMFLLGIHYQKGQGVNENSAVAERYFTRAANGGHARAKLRAQLLSGRKSIMPPSSGLSEDLKKKYTKAQLRVQAELSQNYSFGGYNITIMFNDCKKVLDNFNEFSSDSSAHMNLEFLPYDPFLEDLTLLEDVNESECTSDAIEMIIEELQRAGTQNPALTDDLLQDLYGVYTSLRNPSLNLLRKRFVRLYKAWIGEKGFPVPDGVEDPLLFKKSKVAEKLVQNIGRCGDGLSIFFAEEELAFSLQSEEIPFGLRIANVLAQYKESFLQQYQKFLTEWTDNVETVTETMVVIRQKLRLPLGLPGIYSGALYASYASTDAIFQHGEMITAFIRGAEYKKFTTAADGYSLVPHEMTILPYTVSSVCNFFQKVMEDRENKVLSISHINDFISCDPILKEAAESALIDFEPNIFVDPLIPQDQSPYTNKTIERILFLHGYVLGHNPYY